MCWYCVVDCSRVDTVLLMSQGWHCVVDSSRVVDCSMADTVLLIALGLTLCC